LTIANPCDLAAGKNRKGGPSWKKPNTMREAGDRLVVNE